MLKKLLSFALLIYSGSLLAQADETYIVADNGVNLYSCEDSLLTLESIYNRAGIKDLNDPNATVNDYTMVRLNGVVITNDVIEQPIRYSDYDKVFIQKNNRTPGSGHWGVSIFLHHVTLPERLFSKDTLEYFVDKNDSTAFFKDVAENIDFTSIMYSGGDFLLHNLFFTDEKTGVEYSLRGNTQWYLGKGTYKIRASATICGANAVLWDSIYVVVNETPCLQVEIKGMPGYCREDMMDITPYVYIDGQVATPAQLAQTTFWDRSDMFIPSIEKTEIEDPTSVNIASMYNFIYKYPNIEIAYQPNTDYGICKAYIERLSPKVPTKWLATADTVFAKNNKGFQSKYVIDGDYYGFNNSFDKDLFSKLYLESYDVFDGTVFEIFKDNNFVTEVNSSNLSPATYYIRSLNPSYCAYDTSVFIVNVKNRDFEITWMKEENKGPGYYTFTAPEYAGASYSWMWGGGSIVSGLNTNQVTVYYTNNHSSMVSIQCKVTLPNTRLTSGGSLNSALYLDLDEEEIILGNSNSNLLSESTNTSVVLPNPAKGFFAISGTGVYDLKIYNTLGVLIYQNSAYKADTSINMDETGMHVIHLSQEGKTRFLKVYME
jgi:hypothetical protein